MTDELPVFQCWRCDSECDTDWIDVSVFGETEPRVAQGRTRCTNERCINRFSQAAHLKPSPEELERRGQQALDRVRAIAEEGR